MCWTKCWSLFLPGPECYRCTRGCSHNSGGSLETAGHRRSWTRSLHTQLQTIGHSGTGTCKKSLKIINKRQKSDRENISTCSWLLKQILNILSLISCIWVNSVSNNTTHLTFYSPSDKWTRTNTVHSPLLCILNILTNNIKLKCHL